MKSYRLKFRICSFIAFVLLLPAVSMAADVATTTATTTLLIGGQAKSVLETVQKDEKKEEIRKQLKDTIDLCSALISKMQDIEGRVLERVSILVSQENLSKDSQDKMSAMQKKLDETLAGANDRVNNNLPKLAEAVMNASKPAKSVTAFKKEVNHIKGEITAAYKLVVEMIDLVKKETSNDAQATTTPDQSPEK